MKRESLRRFRRFAAYLHDIGCKTGWRKQQRGFTLVTATVSTLVAGVILSGSWLAYGDLQTQWRVSHAERMMDQYAAATMQELANNLSWAWGAKNIQSNPRNIKWAFYMDDIIQEGRLFAAEYRYQLGPDHALELTYRPTRGILFNSFSPKWASDRLNTQYIWSGTGGSPRGVLKTFDRRDRMTLEGILLDFNLFPYLRDSIGVSNNPNRAEVVTVYLTMHYTYNSSPWFNVSSRLFGSSYVRERTYTTQIAMRNWDVENNKYKDRLLGRTTSATG